MNRLGACPKVRLTVKHLNQNEQLITSAHSKSPGLQNNSISTLFLWACNNSHYTRQQQFSLTKIFTVNHQGMEQRPETKKSENIFHFGVQVEERLDTSQSGLYQKQCDQQGEGEDSVTLLHSHVTPHAMESWLEKPVSPSTSNHLQLKYHSCPHGKRV